MTSRPEDNGLALVNPHMGWTMHFYSNILDNYGSKLDPADTLDDFPGLNTVYLRVPWAFVEPEEGRFVWELLDTPAQRWIDKGCMVAFRISAMESWLYSATPNGSSRLEPRDTTSTATTRSPNTTTPYSSPRSRLSSAPWPSDTTVRRMSPLST